MEPVTTGIAETAGKSAAETTKSAFETGTAKGLETTAEAREAIIGEEGLIQQIDSIKSESIEAVAARNEAKLNELSQIEANRESGRAREAAVHDELERKYPAEDGFHIEPQCYLRDTEGSIVRDPQTSEGRRPEGRRLDFGVIKDGEVKASYEVTSEKAYKTAQMDKEARIRDAGGNCIKDHRTGELVPFAPGVQTEVVRRA